MSLQSAQLRPADAAAVPAPEMLEQRIGQLIGHYLHTRSPAIAQSIVRHIDSLCNDPGFEGDCTQRCAYLRMRAHWRWLAAQRHDTSSPVQEN